MHVFTTPGEPITRGGQHSVKNVYCMSTGWGVYLKISMLAIPYIEHIDQLTVQKYSLNRQLIKEC